MENFTLCTIFRTFGVFYIKSKGSNDTCMFDFVFFFLNNLGLFFLSYPGQFGNDTHSLTSVQFGAIYVQQQRRDVSVSVGEGNKNIMRAKAR